MVRGMVVQIFIGCLAGLVSNYEMHMLLRYLAAVCCAQMYTAGQVICKSVKSIFLKKIFLRTDNPIHNNSYRHNGQQISNDFGLFLRKLLVHWRYSFASNRFH